MCNNEITQPLLFQGESMLNVFINGCSVASKVNESNLKTGNFMGDTQKLKLQRIFTTMWNKESVNFNSDVNLFEY